jgi:hypothetical protein
VRGAVIDAVLAVQPSASMLRVFVLKARQAELVLWTNSRVLESFEIQRLAKVVSLVVVPVGKGLSTVRRVVTVATTGAAVLHL